MLGAAALVSAVVGLAGAALAQEAPAEPTPAPLEGATVTDAGWWNRYRPQVDLPTGQPPAPPTPGVPAGSLVVGAAGGEPDAVTAIGVRPESPPGAIVESFELLLREVDDDGANLNTTFAAIVACPVTGFWLGGENGVWETQPAYDCSLAETAGTRAEDGSWTFDLTAIGQLWSDGAVDANGVVLVEAVEAPTGFRTVFAGLADLAIGVRYAASGGDEPSTTATTRPATSGGGTVTPPRPTGGSGGGVRPPAGGGAPTPTSPAPTTTVAATGDETAGVDLPTVPVAGEAPSPLGSLPWWSALLLVLAVGFGLAAMFALGPAGEPVTASTGRGVTRALEARLHPEEP